jgi:hypothetical protein
MKVLPAALALCCLVISWCYAAAYWSASNRGVPVEFYPFWNASRSVLHHGNPYSNEVTVENQVAAYGGTSRSVGLENEQRFAYPVSALLPLLPLGLISFPIANTIVFFLFVAATILAVGWLRRTWDRTTAFYCLLTFSAYPIIYDLRSRQPTLLFFGLAVAGLALVRSGRLTAGAILAALSLGKPHLGLSVLLAELIWSLARWQERKRFALALLGSLLGVFFLSLMLTPGWISEWLGTLRAYSQYNQPSVVVSAFGSSAGSIVSALLLLALIALLWLHRESELLQQAALSVSIISLLIPYANYNAVMLLIPTLWVVDNSVALMGSGELDQLMLGAAKVALILFFAVNIVGFILLQTSNMGKLIGWMLPSMATHALLFCLVGVMVSYYFTLLSSRHTSTACVGGL